MIKFIYHQLNGQSKQPLVSFPRGAALCTLRALTFISPDSAHKVSKLILKSVAFQRLDSFRTLFTPTSLFLHA